MDLFLAFLQTIRLFQTFVLTNIYMNCCTSQQVACIRVEANSDFETNMNSIHFLDMKRIRIRIVFGFQKTIRIYSNSSNYSNMNTNSANSY